MYKFSLILLCIFLFHSCIYFRPPRRVANNFEFCYDGEIKNQTIKTEGYYQLKKNWWNTSGAGENYNPRWDTSIINFKFFPDGICIYEIRMEKYLDNLNDSINKHPFEEYARFNGLYKVNSDTIKIQVVNDVRLAAPTWGAFEFVYIIIDEKKLKYLGFRVLTNEKFYANKFVFAKDKMDEEKNSFIANYVPLQNIPPSGTWLKNLKWFWCSKEEYKKWKKSKKN